jgi:hypothetical protein
MVSRMWLCLATLLALLGLSADLSHMVLVSHTVCAEHGEVVHGGDSHEVPSASPDDDVPGQHASNADRTSAADHEHCCGVATHGGALLAAPPALPTQLLGAFDELTIAPAGATITRRLYLLAPKTSPPA